MRPTVSPARITVIVSEISITSSSLCVISTTVLPSVASRRSTSHSSLTSGGDSTAVGSSRMRSFAPRYSTLRISTRCASPTERSETRRSGATTSPVRLPNVSHLGVRRRAVEPHAASRLAPEHDVLGDRERRHEHEVLVHHADAGVDRLASPPAGDVAAVELDRAAVGWCRPARIRISVDLPAPFSPTSAWISPRGHLEGRAAVRLNGAEALADPRR